MGVLRDISHLHLLNPESGISRSAALVIAASDSTDKCKSQSDIVCSGAADQVDFAEARDAISGDIYVHDGIYDFSAALTVARSADYPIHWRLSKGAIIKPSADVNIFNMVRGSEVSGGKVDCSGLATWDSAVFYFDGVQHFGHQITRVSDMWLVGLEGASHGKAFFMECEATGESVSNVYIEDISMQFFTYGVHQYCHAPSGSAFMNDNHFIRLSYLWKPVYGFYQDISPTAYNDASRNIIDMHMQCGDDTLRGLVIDDTRNQVEAYIVDVTEPTGAFYAIELTANSSLTRARGEFGQSVLDSGGWNSVSDEGDGRTRLFGFQQQIIYVETTYTARLRDNVIRCSSSGGAYTITLPEVTVHVGKGHTFTFFKTDSSVNAITLDGYGDQTINGAATNAEMDAQYDSLTIVTDGANWYITQHWIH